MNREQTTSSRGRLGPAPPAQALPICEGGAFKILGLLLSPPIQRLNCLGDALGSRKRGLKGGQWRNLPFLPQVPPPLAWGGGSDMGAQGSHGSECPPPDLHYWAQLPCRCPACPASAPPPEPSQEVTVPTTCSHSAHSPLRAAPSWPCYFMNPALLDALVTTCTSLHLMLAYVEPSQKGRHLLCTSSARSTWCPCPRSTQCVETPTPPHPGLRWARAVSRITGRCNQAALMFLLTGPGSQ